MIRCWQHNTWMNEWMNVVGTRKSPVSSLPLMSSDEELFPQKNWIVLKDKWVLKPTFFQFIPIRPHCFWQLPASHAIESYICDFYKRCPRYFNFKAVLWRNPKCEDLDSYRPSGKQGVSFQEKSSWGSDGQIIKRTKVLMYIPAFNYAGLHLRSG